MPGNKSEARDVVWLLVWNGTYHIRLAKAVPVLGGNIAKTATVYTNAFSKPCSFLSHTSKLGSAHPNTDCLAASNGVCTKRNKAWFELSLFESEVNNNLQK